MDIDLLQKFLNEESEKIKQLEKKISNLEKQYNLVKNNCLSALFFCWDSSGLYYIKTNNLLFIFSSKTLAAPSDFMQDFFINYVKNRSEWTFGRLNPSCSLFQEHCETFKNGNILLYKYVDRDGLVNKTIVSKDAETDELYVESKYLGKESYSAEENRIIYADQPRRKIINGITVNKMLANKSSEKKREILCNVFDYLFSKYPAKSGDKDKVSGILLDTHMSNIIVNDEGYHLIDKDVVCSEDVSKSQILYRNFQASPTYNYLINYFGLKDEAEEYWKTYPLLHRITSKTQQVRTANAALLKKYFSEEAYAPRNYLSENPISASQASKDNLIA